MNPSMVQDLAKCREAELRMSRTSNAARRARREGWCGRSAVFRNARLRGRALLGRLLVEAGLHLITTSE
ncbi:MAG: hypothetical protein ABSA91_10690 [Acidimicrobiales bacterium]